MSLQTQDDIAQLAGAMIDAIGANELDRAEALWFQLRDLPHAAPAALAAGAFIYILRGQPQDALHYLNTLPDDCCPDLKALCTYLTGDPIWHSQATALEESSDPLVRSAMRHLLAGEAQAA